MKSIGDAYIANKKVIVRADLNLPIIDGKIIDHTRFNKTLPTIKYILKNAAKVLVISHYGRPDGSYKKDLSLEFLVELFQISLQNYKIAFAISIEDAREKLNDNDLVILENLRFNLEEEKNSSIFAQELASLGDIYVNEAFSCSHRSHASIDAITKYLPSYGGFLLIEEIQNLNNLFDKNNKSLTAIIGGSKISTKLDLLISLIDKADNIIIGGAMANNFLKILNINIGKSLYEKDMLDITKSIIDKAKKRSCKILLPIDAKIAINFTEDSQEVDICGIINDYSIFDIGRKTIDLFTNTIENSDMIVWNGPLGVFEHSPFDQGTIEIANNIAKLTKLKKIVSIAGGGDIVAALTKSNTVGDFSYISTAGGAFLEWMEGKELPGIKALN